MNRTDLLILFTSLLFLMTACTSAEDKILQKIGTLFSNSTVDLSETISFPRQKRKNGEWPVMEARARGTLVLVENCLRLQANDPDTSYMLVWPPDFTLKEEDGKVFILDEGKKKVASIGNMVQMSGGEIHRIWQLDQSIQKQVPDRCVEPFWIMGEEFYTLEPSE